MKKTSFSGTVLLLWFIFTLGTFLRFQELSEESLWVDEAFTDHYTSGNWKDMFTFLKRDVHPFGFYGLEYWWVNQFGNSEISLRFLPFIFGSLSILFFFFAVRELYEARTALLGTLFFSLSYTFILYSQEAKMYAQFIFFFLSAVLFVVLFLRKPSWGNAILLALANIGLLHTQILSIPIIAAEFMLYLLAYTIQKKQGEDLFFLCFKKHSYFSLARVGIVFILVVGSYLLWLPIFYYQFRRLFLDMLPLKFAQKFGFDGFYVIMLIAILSSLVVVSFFFYLASSKRGYKRMRLFVEHPSLPAGAGILFFLAWIVINVFYYHHFFGNLFYMRYLLFLFPFWYIFLARLFLKLPRTSFMVLFFIYLAATSFILIQYYTVDGKEQWREVAEYIQEEAGADDVLLFHAAGHTHRAFNYYYSGLIPQVKLNKAFDAVKISAALEGKTSAFLILSHNYETKDFFPEFMDRSYVLKESKEFIGVTVYKYGVIQW